MEKYILYEKKYRNGSYKKAVPGHGESVNRQVDERGKLEQTRKNRNKCEQTRKK